MAETKENIEQPTSQDGALDSAAVKVIERITGQDFTSKGEEQQASQDEPLKQEEQQEYAITEEQLDGLKELGYSEEDLNEFEPTDIENILSTKTAKPAVEQAETAEEDVIITDKMAQKYAQKYGGIAKSFVGKSVGELFEAITNNNKQIQKLTADLKQHKEVLTKNELSKVDELEKELKTSQDLTEEDFWKKHQELVDLQVEAKIRASQADPAQAQEQAEAIELLQSQLPEGMQAMDVYNEWAQGLSPQAKEAYSKSTDIVIIEAVKNFALLKKKETIVSEKDKELENSKKEADAKARILAAKKVTDALKAAKGQPVNGSKYTIIPRGQGQASKDYGDLDPVVVDILKRKEAEFAN